MEVCLSLVIAGSRTYVRPQQGDDRHMVDHHPRALRPPSSSTSPVHPVFHSVVSEGHVAVGVPHVKHLPLAIDVQERRQVSFSHGRPATLRPGGPRHHERLWKQIHELQDAWRTCGAACDTHQPSRKWGKRRRGNTVTKKTHQVPVRFSCDAP